MSPSSATLQRPSTPADAPAAVAIPPNSPPEAPAVNLWVIRPAACLRWLLGCIALLAAASLGANLVERLLPAEGSGGVREIAARFDLDSELSVPAWFSSLQLAFCAGLLACVAAASRQQRRGDVLHWSLLAALFVAMSVDEAASLHEILIVPLRRWFDASGALHFAWVIAAIPLLAVLGIAYFRFLLRLPPRSRVLFIAAGCLYVAGAVGMEMVGGWFADTAGLDSTAYLIAATVEEVLEMTGLALFAYALMDYLQLQHLGHWEVRFAA